MHPYVNLFGYEMSSYSLMALIGCVVCLVFLLLYCTSQGVRRDDMLFFFAYVLIGVIIGAVVLYCLVNLPGAIANRAEVFSDWRTAISYLFGGFVYYGGLIGGFVGAVCYAKYFNVNSVRIADTFVPAIPLFHCLGRIGCFLAGCCYGIEYDGPLAVTFTNALSDANGPSRFPVQLLEAAINLLLFIILLVYARVSKKRDRWKPLGNFGLYLILYGIARFFLEFLRGDEVRGFLGPLSVSQWISIAIVTAGLYFVIRKTEHNVVVQKVFNGVMQDMNNNHQKNE